jgi:uncharacterized protein (DUF4415 family)
MICEWDPHKAAANFRKHGVRFSEAEPVFADDYADTIPDDESDPKGKRGRILPPEPEPPGKTRITIRLDEDLVDYFLKESGTYGGAKGYQTLINEALRQHVEGKAPKLEETLRRILREEMLAAS